MAGAAGEAGAAGAAVAVPIPNDLSLEELRHICRTEDSAQHFARQNHLLSDPDRAQLNAGMCIMGTHGCQGEAYLTEVFDKGKHRKKIYCPGPQCRKKRAYKNGFVNGVLTTKGDRKGALKTAVERLLGPTSQALLLTFHWAEQLQPKYAQRSVGTAAHPISERSVQRFYDHLNRIALEKLNNMPPMQPADGTSVEIDEALFKGSRKYHRGRYLELDLLPPEAHGRNHGDLVQAPWVFGMICRDQDDKIDFRMFSVDRRDAETLRPIVLRHVAPGSRVHSDQWGAYNDLTNWGGNDNFDHRSVNHEEQFVDYVSGANTQRVEGGWGHVKLAIMRCGKGARDNLQEHLAHFWFAKKYEGRAFAAALRMLSEYRHVL